MKFVARTTLTHDTGDGTWDTVSLASLIPATATGVLIRAVNTNAGTNATVGFRKTGSVNDGNVQVSLAVVSHGFFMVGVNGSQQVDLYKLNGTVTFYLEAYFGAEAVFFDNVQSNGPGGAGVWTYGVTGVSGAVAIIMYSAGTCPAFHWNGNGGIDGRVSGLGACRGSLIVPCDATGNGQVTGIDGTELFQAIGYLKSGVTFFTGGSPEYGGLGTTGSYQSIDIQGSGRRAVFGVVYKNNGTGAWKYSFRKPGDVDDLYYTHAFSGQSSFLVQTGNGQVEGKVENTGAVFDFTAAIAVEGFSLSAVERGASFVRGLCRGMSR